MTAHFNLVRRRQSGIAIVLVLSILILLTAVVVAFFTNATTDLTASKSYSDQTRVKLLANSAVNLVEGQIRAATKGTDANGNTLAWASQPGLIRTYGAPNAGDPVATYKLYSSDILQVTDANSPFNPVTAEAQEIPANWNARPSDFVDLNSPLVEVDPAGNITDPTTNQTYSARFPIIDGNNLGVPAGGTALTYLDQNNSPSIAGFSVLAQPTCDPSKIIAANNNPVPMPVRWLYMLQNGELHPRDPASPYNVPGASSTNPVVGRIAFWTDDDTCKLNVNTASEGTFWDRPYANTPTELKYAQFIPAQNEFQMFPGHPAKTCLSTVFGDSLYSQSQPAGAQKSTSLFAGWLVPGYMDTTVGTGIFVPYFLTASSYNQLLPYYDLVPRVTSGLSQGSSDGSAGGTKIPNVPTGIVYDPDRLYDSVDELMFTTATNASNPPSRSARNVAANVPGGVQLLPHFLETARFFLTTSNRAPEVTLLNTPRVSLWPLQLKNDVAHRTAKEELLAFCSTIPSSSNNPYYFQRYNAETDSTSPSSESSSLDWTGVPRNPLLYLYLHDLMQADVPGLGGNFAAKYPHSSDQILTEMMDQIRSGVNTWATSSGTASPASSYAQLPYNSGERVVVPLQPQLPAGKPGAGTQGFGRFPTITEAAIDFVRLNDPIAAGTTTTPNPHPIRIGAVLILQAFNPSPGQPPVSPNLQIEVKGLDGFNIQPIGDPTKERFLGFPSSPSPINIVDAIANLCTGGETTGFLSSAEMFFYTPPGTNQPAKAKSLSAPFGDDTHYPFFNSSASFVGLPTDTETTFGAGELPSGTNFFDFNALAPVPITINIYTNVPRGTKGTLVQTINMQFPSSTKLPVPAYTANRTAVISLQSVYSTRLGSHTNQQNDQRQISSETASGLIDPRDVVRSVVVNPLGPTRGDLRVIAALHNVPAPTGNLATDYFAPHPFYNYGDRTTGGKLTALDPNRAGSAGTGPDFNWRFAESLRGSGDTGFGAMGWYDYGSTPAAPTYLAVPPKPEAALSPPIANLGSKSAYSGALINVANVTGAASNGPVYGPDSFPAVPPGTGFDSTGKPTGVQLTDPLGTSFYPGDWDTGFANLEDGPFINKPDESNSSTAAIYPSNPQWGPLYFSRWFGNNESGQSYSPNREIASAVAFGSLPTGIDPNAVAGGTTIRPWQTLLFGAEPAAGLNHPGFGVPSDKNAPLPSSGIPAPPYSAIPDHYVLDLFTMPIVEPYAISEPLSTQGKVNMNYQIAPFTYLRRDTAVQAVLRGTRMTAIPSSAAVMGLYKASRPQDGVLANAGSPYQFRYAINPDETTGTLKGFEDRFNGGDIFRSASEICSIPLVPAKDMTQTYDPSIQAFTPTYSTMPGFWGKNQLTGDNLREEPYGDLYPRLTTKSNAFTVHVRVQTLKKAVGTSQGTFTDPTDTTVNGPKDIVTAEYRGSYQIERYVDPNITSSGSAPNSTTETTDFPDYAGLMANGTALNAIPPISNFYKFHTINTTQFQ